MTVYPPDLTVDQRDDTLRRAVRFARIPGVTRAAARARFGVSARALTAALRELTDSRPTTADLVLAALTRNGELLDGPLPDFDGVAAWLRYVDKDDSTGESVRAVFEGLVADGVLIASPDGWWLNKPWP